MLAAAKAKMHSPIAPSSVWSSEEIFSLAAAVAAALESHQGKTAVNGQKPHQGIFSENRSTRVSEMWAKWSATHQVSEWCGWKIVLGPTNYLYDGWNALEEVDNAGNVLARYTQRREVDEPLSGTAVWYGQLLRGGCAGFDHVAQQLCWRAGKYLHVRWLREADGVHEHDHKPIPVHGA